MPLISVILPVYNSENYLREAIDSILDQTFRDFELILVNDGSSDNSENIILSYNDPRIVYVNNRKNLGLITTLNNATKLAKGKYIARMDADDVSLPQRFEVQLKCFSENPQAKLVCTPIRMLSSEGLETGVWPADQQAQTPEEIKQLLPWENCIAHPGIMIESSVLKKYGFAANQKGSEDWDLWLRLVRDNVVIIKTKEILLNYRVHTASATQIYNTAKSSQIKAALVKLKFAWSSLKQVKLNFFVLKTLFTIYKDLGYHVKSRVLPYRLRQLKWLFTINPFKAYSQYRSLRTALAKHDAKQFLFFPYFHIGGAEKVHAQITQAIEDQQPFVFFTGLDNLSDHKSLFGSKAVLLETAQALYHPFFAKRSEQLILQKINYTADAHVFGCNNLFFYDLILKLNKNVVVADLTHDYDYVAGKDFAQNYLASFLRCNTRVFISNKTVERLMAFYTANGVGEEYKNRLKLIYNYTEKPKTLVNKDWQPPYKILYVGRDTFEKRVNIVFRLAELCEQEKLPFEFMLVGEITKPATVSKNVQLKGLILDAAKLSEMYSQSHFIMISSSSEGFPLSIAEGMSHGCIPLSTAVGDIPFHIKGGENGFLVVGKNDESVAQTFLSLLKMLPGNDLEQVSQNALQYAQLFDKATFVKKYRTIFGLALPV